MEEPEGAATTNDNSTGKKIKVECFIANVIGKTVRSTLRNRLQSVENEKGHVGVLYLSRYPFDIQTKVS